MKSRIFKYPLITLLVFFCCQTPLNTGGVEIINDTDINIEVHIHWMKMTVGLKTWWKWAKVKVKAGESSHSKNAYEDRFKLPKIINEWKVFADSGKDKGQLIVHRDNRTAGNRRIRIGYKAERDEQGKMKLKYDIVENALK